MHARSASIDRALMALNKSGDMRFALLFSYDIEINGTFINYALR